MATIYVSYKGNEEPFVKNVVDRLKPKHEIFVDYKMPPGVVYQKHMLAMLKSAKCLLFLYQQIPKLLVTRTRR